MPSAAPPRDSARRPRADLTSSEAPGERTLDLALEDLDALDGVARRACASGITRRDRERDIHALGDLAKDRVAAGQMWHLAERDEELRTVRVRPGVRHAQHTRRERGIRELVGHRIARTPAAGAGGVAPLGDE